MVPVYEKHLTKGEVDALVAFYSDPKGQKILNEMPAMTSEAMQAASWNYAKTYDEYDTACSKRDRPGAKDGRNKNGQREIAHGPVSSSLHPCLPQTASLTWEVFALPTNQLRGRWEIA